MFYYSSPGEVPANTSQTWH